METDLKRAGSFKKMGRTICPTPLLFPNKKLLLTVVPPETTPWLPVRTTGVSPNHWGFRDKLIACSLAGLHERLYLERETECELATDARRVGSYQYRIVSLSIFMYGKTPNKLPIMIPYREFPGDSRS